MKIAKGKVFHTWMLVLLGGTAFLWAGCDQGYEETSMEDVREEAQEVQEEAQDVGEELSEVTSDAAQETAEQANEMRQEVQASLSEEINELKNSVSELQAELVNAATEARTAAEPKIQAVYQEIDRMETQLTAMSDATQENWEGLKQDLRTSLDRVRASLNQIGTVEPQTQG
jgi:uncharacterized coiled-coil DUF342 family protein